MNSKTRILSPLFGIVTFLFSLVFVSAEFSDIPIAHENWDAIDYVESEGIVNGYPDGTFRPDAPINRAEFTKIIIGAVYEGSVIDACTTASFPDVPESEWFAPYVCVAEANGIVGGYPDGTFRPTASINFVEAAKIIVAAFGYDSAVTQDPDVWYKGYVDLMANMRAIPITLDGFESEVTRGEMAEMIYRIRAELFDNDSHTYESLAGLSNPIISRPKGKLGEFCGGIAAFQCEEGLLCNLDGDYPDAGGECIQDPENLELEIDIDAFQYGFDPEEIVVVKGTRLIFHVRSLDVEHGFSIPEYSIDEIIPAGETVTIEFVADKTGRFTYSCSVFCGSGHGDMEGALVVEETE